MDSRYALLTFRGMTACTPNESEVEQLLGIRSATTRRAGTAPAASCSRAPAPQAVLVTRGSRGMALFQPRTPTMHIPIFGSDQIADVTGAGDTVIATMTLALASGGTFEEAAHLANYAGGLVVMKRGTATVTARDSERHHAEIARADGTDRYPRSNWLRSSTASARRAARWRLRTAASTCCTSDTSAICKLPREKPIA